MRTAQGGPGARRLLFGGLVIALCLAWLPAGARPRTTPPRPISALEVLSPRAVHDLSETRWGRNMLAAIESMQQGEVFTNRFVWAEGFGDLSGDGARDLMVGDVTYKITFGEDLLDPTVEIETHSRYHALNGLNGKTMWRFGQKVEDGWLSAIDARLGPKADPGVLFIRDQGVSGPVVEQQTTITAKRGSDGKKLWARDYQGVIVERATLHAFEGVPVSIDTFDGLKGPHTDLLLGLGTIVYGGAATVADVQAIVINGKDGSEHAHPIHEVGVGWVPQAWAVGDLDGDSLDDYVFTNKYTPSIGGGEGHPPAEVGDVLKSRRGTDGLPGWTAGGLTFGEFAWVYQVGQVVGNRTVDLAITTPKPGSLLLPDGSLRKFDSYLVEGSVGSVQWRRAGGWPIGVGDIDKDGAGDVITTMPKFRWSDTKMSSGAQLRAWGGAGNRLWQKTYSTSVPAPTCAASCSGGMAMGYGRAGDMQPDRLMDVGLQVDVDTSDGGSSTRALVIDARTGKVLHEGGRELWWFNDSLDGFGDDIATIDWQLRGFAVEAADGRDGSPLFDTDVNYDVPFNPRDLQTWLTTISLDKDDCSELVAIANARQGAYVTVLDGGNGKIKWTRTIYGRDATITADATDHSEVC